MMKKLQPVYLLLMLLALHQTDALLFKQAAKLLPKLGKLFKLEDSAEAAPEEGVPSPKEEKKTIFDLPKILLKGKSKLFNDHLFDSKEKFDLFKPKLLKDLFNLEDKLAEKTEKFVEKLEKKDDLKEKLLDLFEEKKEEKLNKVSKEEGCHVAPPVKELKYVPEYKYVPVYDVEPLAPPPPPPMPVTYSYVPSHTYYPKPPSYEYEPPAPPPPAPVEYSYYPAPAYHPAPAPAPAYLPEPPAYEYEPPSPPPVKYSSYLPYPATPHEPPCYEPAPPPPPPPAYEYSYAPYKLSPAYVPKAPCSGDDFST